MTSRERVQAAFRHQEPDRVPVFEQTVCARIASEIMGRRMRTGGGRIRWEETAARWESEEAWQEYVGRLIEDVGDLNRELGFDMVSVPWRHAARPSVRLGEFTFRYDSPETGTWSVYHYDEVSDVFDEVDSSADREGIPALERMVGSWDPQEHPPTPPDPSDYDILMSIAQRAGGDRYLVSAEGMLMIPPHPAWLEACASRPDLIERYLDGAVAWAELAIPVLARLGVGCLWAGGDLACSAGPIYSPAMFRRFILPRLQKVVRAAHEAGLVYLFRTDGNVWPIAQDLFVNSGVDGYGEIDIDAGMRLPEIKRRLPHLTLWGGMSCGKMLSFGTPEQIRDEVQRVLAECMPGGGLIFGSSNSIHHGIPTRNFLAMQEAVREHGLYR
jgi:uroporphyrinogen decarboxylase